MVGRRTFDVIEAWGGSHPVHGVPVFVLTHNVPEDVPEGATPFTFVTDGIESAVEQAKSAAGGKNVGVSGANTAQQCIKIKAALFDEMEIHLVPVLLGEGTRLFDHIGAEQIELERTRVIEAPGMTHLRFRVLKGKTMRGGCIYMAEVRLSLPGHVTPDEARLCAVLCQPTNFRGTAHVAFGDFDSPGNLFGCTLADYDITRGTLRDRLGYTLQFENDGTLTITPAELTVTADDASRLYGEATPEFTVSYEGFKLDDDESVVDGELTIKTLATESSLPGTYVISLSGDLTSPNYIIGLRDGALTVQIPPTNPIVPGAPEGAYTAALVSAYNVLTEGQIPGTEISRAVEVDKALLQMWSLRGAPYLFPTSDAAIFTLGLLPGDEESLRAFIFGAIPALDQIGISATEVVECTAEAVRQVLDGREMTKDELGVELANRVEPHLNARQQAQWRSPSWYAAQQLLGESVVRFALYVVPLHGMLCFAPRRGKASTFIRTDQWLGAPLPGAIREQARAELVRRYLHCFGPSTPTHFAEWAGISPAQAGRAWNLVERELVAVDFEGRETWVCEDDVPLLKSPPAAEGIRFLPPHDPYLQLRDRETLIPNTALHRELWRSSGNPGVVLVNGKAVAQWRPQKRGKKLRITVESFKAGLDYDDVEIEAEATTLAPFKGCSSVEVEFR